MEAFVGSFAGSSVSAATTAATAELCVARRRVAPASNTTTTMSVRIGGAVDGISFKSPKFTSVDAYDTRSKDYDFQRTAAGTGQTPFDIRKGIDGLPKHANSRDNDIKTFRNMDLYTDDLVWVRNGAGTREAAAAVVKQVFGNAHLFESETLEFAPAISTFLDSGNVRELVRTLGQSEAYAARFFHAVTPMRTVELNFKHFMGRAPRSQAEYAQHMATMQNKGFAAEVNSYLDSPEYDSLYSTSRVPAINFRGGHETDAEMNALAILNGPNCSSDKSLSTAPLFPAIDGRTGVNGIVVKRGLPDAWLGENAAREKAGLSFKVPGAAPPLPTALQADALAWKAKMGVWNKYYYADSLPYQEIFTPVMSHSEEEEQEAAAILKYGSLMAKNYTGGARKNFDCAPIIEMSSPGSDPLAGFLKVGLGKITTTIPKELKQEA